MAKKTVLLLCIFGNLVVCIFSGWVFNQIVDSRERDVLFAEECLGFAAAQFMQDWVMAVLLLCFLSIIALFVSFFKLMLLKN